MSSDPAENQLTDGETVEMEAPDAPSEPIGSVVGPGPANDPLFWHDDDDDLMPLGGMGEDEDDDGDAVLNSLAPGFWADLREGMEPHPDDAEPAANTLTADMAQVQPDLVEEDEERAARPLAFWIAALGSEPGKGDNYPELAEVLAEVSIGDDALAAARRGARSLARVASRLNARMIHLHRDENSLRAISLGIFLQTKHVLDGSDRRVDGGGLRVLMDSRPVARAVLEVLVNDRSEWAESGRSQLEQALVLLNAALPSERVVKPTAAPAPVVSSAPEPQGVAFGDYDKRRLKYALPVVGACAFLAAAYWLPILLHKPPPPPPDSALQAVIVEIRSVKLEGDILILTVKESWADRGGWARAEDLERLLDSTGSYEFEEAHLKTPSGRLLATISADYDVVWGKGVAPPS